MSNDRAISVSISAAMLGGGMVVAITAQLSGSVWSSVGGLGVVAAYHVVRGLLEDRK
jgi:hypothetical protein